MQACVLCNANIVIILYLPIYLPSVYANVDVKAQKSTTVSKTMFANHVNEMHCNRGEGFEREFKVCVCMCVFKSACKF